MASYKERKEAFVSNLGGTSMAEIALISLLLPAALCLRALLWRTLSKRTDLRALPAAVAWLLEFATVGLPPLLSVVAAQHIYALLGGTLALSAALSCLDPSTPTEAAQQAAVLAAQLTRRQKHHVALFRGTMMLTTCVCILAVDFHVFPRRFAKVETYGAPYPHHHHPPHEAEPEAVQALA